MASQAFPDQCKDKFEDIAGLSSMKDGKTEIRYVDQRSTIIEDVPFALVYYLMEKNGSASQQPGL